jgi:hypothetical protein
MAVTAPVAEVRENILGMAANAPVVEVRGSILGMAANAPAVELRERRKKNQIAYIVPSWPTNITLGTNAFAQNVE